MSYLLQTPASHFSLMKIPKDLRNALDKREIKKPLKTENKQRATRLAAVYAIKCQDLFESLREPKMTNPLFTFIKMAGIEKKPEGSVKIDGLEMDPDKPGAEARSHHAANVYAADFCRSGGSTGRCVFRRNRRIRIVTF